MHIIRRIKMREKRGGGGGGCDDIASSQGKNARKDELDSGSGP